MSTSTADEGSMVRFTDDILQPNAADPSNIGHPSTTAHSKRIQTFYKGQPMALGVTQLLGGVIQILLAVVHEVGDSPYASWTMSLFVGFAPYISGILCIISGALCIAAAKNPTIKRVRGSLIANIISAVTAAIEVIINIIFIFLKIFVMAFMNGPCNNETQTDTCQMIHNAFGVSWGIVFLILIYSVLALCVSISIAAFGCKTVCRTAFSEVTVVMYQAEPPKTGAVDEGAVLPSVENVAMGEVPASNEDNEKV